METNLKTGMNKSPETDINSEDDGKQLECYFILMKKV